MSRAREPKRQRGPRRGVNDDVLGVLSGAAGARGPAWTLLSLSPAMSWALGVQVGAVGVNDGVPVAVGVVGLLRGQLGWSYSMSVVALPRLAGLHLKG